MNRGIALVAVLIVLGSLLVVSTGAASADGYCESDHANCVSQSYYDSTGTGDVNITGVFLFFLGVSLLGAAVLGG